MQKLLARLHYALVKKEDAMRHRLVGRIVLLMEHAIPFTQNDAALRTHAMATALTRLGHSVVVMTLPESSALSADGMTSHLSVQHAIDGVGYLRLQPPLADDYPASVCETIKVALRVFKPGLLLIGPDWQNALLAAIASRELGLPYYYLVPDADRSAGRPVIEIHLAHAADGVWTADAELRDAMIGQGVAADKISLIADAHQAHAMAALLASLNDAAKAVSRQAARLAATLPRLQPAKVDPIKQLRVAAVMDDGTFHSYAPLCHLQRLRPGDVIAGLEQLDPELLFVASMPGGENDLWAREIAPPGPELQAALTWCNERRIPTVFWNREDPIQFDFWLASASQFDFVFTTDIDCIGRYKAVLNHERVYLLPLAIQPQQQHRVQIHPRKDAFCFVGGDDLGELARCKDLESCIAGLATYRPVEVFEGSWARQEDGARFSGQFQSYGVGPLPFGEIDRVYTRYRYGIDLNAFKQSQSLYGQRVLHLLASNTVAVSNFSRAMRLMFGDLVISTDDPTEMLSRLRTLANEEHAISKVRLAGLRKVMQEHTCDQRLAYIANKVLSIPIGDNLPAMLVLAYAANQQERHTILRGFACQTYQKRQLILICHDDCREVSHDGDATRGPGAIKQYHLQEGRTLTLESILQPGQWVAPMLAQDYYGPNYLLDIALATRYSQASLVGKGAHFEFGNHGVRLCEGEATYCTVPSMAARASAMQGMLLPAGRVWDWLRQLPDLQWRQPGNLAIDPFQYCRNGSISADPKQLSQQVDDAMLDTGIPVERLLRAAEQIAPCSKGGQPGAILGKGKRLVVTNQYPAYDALYRNGFVHSRVRAYRNQGVGADVFCLKEHSPLSFHEFQGVDVITGDQMALASLLADNEYHTVLVHFLDAAMWEILQPYAGKIRIIIWVHGFEIQPWYRRSFLYTTDVQRQAAQSVSERRMDFWRSLLRHPPDNFQLVFVSRHFANEVMEDLGFALPERCYNIIHNPIDTELFCYRPKAPGLRKKILSIRLYDSIVYANDISVKVILALSAQPFFNELQFHMAGDGVLFEETLAPLRQFPNVIIDRRFLSHGEIANLHQQYGIFLCPSRTDTQGVSRDEAMASGLVPVTNAVAAIPEFVDSSCGMLAEKEDHLGLAAGITRLITEPALFSAMSQAAAERVRRQSAMHNIIRSELALIGSNHETLAPGE